ncbi:MAG: HYR domain-containing protein [Saprospiraceae bacterium]
MFSPKPSPVIFLVFLVLQSLNSLFAQGEKPKEINYSKSQFSNPPCEKSPKIICPPYITLCPGASTDPNATGIAKATAGGPNCDNPIVEHIDKITSEGPCKGEKIVQRIWTAIDPNNPNSRAFCIQYIFLEDKEAPSFLNCPRDTSVSSNENCFASLTWKTPFVSDQCSNFSVISSHINGSALSVGKTKIVFTATDACGNSSTCGFNITVADSCCNTPPIISCPSNFEGCYQLADPSNLGRASAVPGELNCSLPIITYLDDTLFQSQCSLRIDRKWIATDPNKPLLESHCIQKINLKDSIKPTIVCPANITVRSNADCMAEVSWNEPTVTDNCSVAKLVSSHKSGTKFPAGITTVFFTVSDGCGNSAGCQFTITVEGNCCTKPPVVVCPADFSGCPQGIEPAITGKGSALKSNMFCTPPVLSFKDDTIFNEACSLRVERRWIALDTSNQLSSSCVQLIDIHDTQSPALEIPNDIIVQSDADCFATVSWAAPSTSDNCSNVTVTSTHISGDKFPLGTTIVSYIATDACGNKTTKSFNILVTDNCCDLPPVLQCPERYISCPNTSIEPNKTGFPSVNVGSTRCRSPKLSFNDEILFTSTCSLFVKRTWTAVDSFKPNLVTSCIQIIELKDTTEPIIICPSDIVVSSDQNCIAVVEWNTPTISDNCTATTISSSHESGAEFTIGTRTIFYTVFDACGNSAGCNFKVTVLDNCCNEPPKLICPADFKGCPQGIEPSITGHAQISASAHCGTPILSYRDDTIYNMACSLFVNRTWLAVDSIQSNLRDSCIQKIELSDVQSPSITCPGNMISLTSANCKAIVRWNEPSTSDNCSNVTVVGSHKSGDEFPIGVTVITYNATDVCGNSSSCTFTLTVIENCCNKSPKVVCPPDAFDCPGSLEPFRLGFPSVQKGHPTCDEPILTYSDVILFNQTCSMRVNRTWLAVDPNNNTLRDSCTQIIDLKDDQSPVFSNCPSNFEVVPNYDCEAFPTWIEPIASDNCRLTSTIRTHAPGSRFLPGKTTVIYTATDACGNKGSCSFEISVSNNCCSKPPQITCPSNYQACPGTSIDPSSAGLAIAIAGSVNCLTPKVGYSDNILKTGPCLGSTTIERTWVAIDPNIINFSATCTQRIVLSDDQKPVILNLPSNLIVDAKGNCELAINWVEPIAMDNCKIQSFTSNKLNGSIFKGGETIITYTAIDACGNTSVASFKVTVTGTEIQVNCPNDTTINRINPYLNGAVFEWDIPKANYCTKCLDTLAGFIYMGEYAGNRYFCSLAPATWFDAKIMCKFNGGNLAVIKNKSENKFISSKLMGTTAWIGASDERRESAFEWVDGTPFIYNNWQAGQPNNGNNNEDYVELFPDGYWNDQNGSISREFICQVPCYSIKQTTGPESGTIIPCGNNKITYVASKDGKSDTCSFNVNVNCDTLSLYCTNKALNTDVMWIDRVSISNVDKTSGNNGGYAFFNQPCADLKSGKEYDLCVEPGFTSGVYTVYWKIWIDFNADFVFQANELVLYGSGNTGLCGKVTLPVNYVSGNTRMRVIMSYGKYPEDACSSILYGEVEDYCVKLSKTTTILVGTDTPNAELKPSELFCVKNCSKVKSRILDVSEQVENYGNNSVLIIPNPANHEIQILLNSKTTSGISIFDLNGKLVWRKFSPISMKEMVDVSRWSEGMYYMVVDSDLDKTISQKFIIQR